MSGIVIHTCYLITLEAKAINHKFEARGGLHTGLDFVANEKPNYCSINKRRIWTAEVFVIKSTHWGFPEPNMAAQNCLQLPSPGIWILLTFERTRHASGIDIHCVGQTFTHIK